MGRRGKRIEFVRDFAKGALARLHLLGEDGSAVRSTSEVVEQGMSGILHENRPVKVWGIGMWLANKGVKGDGMRRRGGVALRFVGDVPEKQMIFRLVPMLEVSTRLIPGRAVLVKAFTSTGGGVMAMGAIIFKRGIAAV